MKVLVYGLMRSGTTLVCDLLSVPGRSLIYSEPMMLYPWRDERVQDIHRVAKAFGLDVGDQPPREADYGTIADYFDRGLAPHMGHLAFWGFKEVHFPDWRETFERHPPDRLVLCARDIRDIVLSALDLITGSRLAFTGVKRLRDEAWLVARLCYDVAELIMMMRALPHHFLRYEDLVGDQGDAAAAALADYVGLEALGTDSLIRELNTGGTRRREVEKHGQGLSSRAVARYERESNPLALALADYVQRILPHYTAAFGYPPASRPAVGPLPYERPPPWLEFELFRSGGPAVLDPAFARRRARLLAASAIRPGSRILDIGCLLPVLKYLLPEGCGYLGLDYSERGHDVAAARWDLGELPRHEPATLLTVLGSLEFVEDVKSFLQALRATGKNVLLSYHTADDTADFDRDRFGWRNSLTRAELRGALEEIGFRVAEQRAFDGYQSLYQLRPADRTA